MRIADDFGCDLIGIQFDAFLQMAQLRQRFLQLDIGRFEKAVHFD